MICYTACLLIKTLYVSNKNIECFTIKCTMFFDKIFNGFCIITFYIFV